MISSKVNFPRIYRTQQSYFQQILNQKYCFGSSFVLNNVNNVNSKNVIFLGIARKSRTNLKLNLPKLRMLIQWLLTVSF